MSNEDTPSDITATTSPHIYFRVKRHKTTYFLSGSIHDKLSTFKKTMAKMLGNGQDPIRLRLSISDGRDPPTYIALDKDNETVQKLNLADEQVLFLTFWDEDAHKWEPVEVEWPDPLVDELEEEEYDDTDHPLEKKSESENSKGKAKAHKSKPRDYTDS